MRWRKQQSRLGRETVVGMQCKGPGDARCYLHEGGVGAIFSPTPCHPCTSRHHDPPNAPTHLYSAQLAARRPASLPLSL